MKVVGISGSLRAASSNAALLRAVARLLPSGMTLSVYEGLGTLPHFNPDLDEEGAVPPPAVAAFRARLREADGVIVSCPEYAHGVPGSFKNALDWVVSSGELGGKPILLLNASPAGGQRAQAAIVQTLTVMEGRVLDASLIAPFLHARIAADGTVADADDRRAIESSLAALATAIRSRDTSVRS